MSHYLDYAFQFTKEDPICASWSNNEFQPLLALSTSFPRIIFLQEEVIIQKYQIDRRKRCTAMEWNPACMNLALGWEDGTVTIWTEEDQTTKDDKTIHKAPIACITFSPDGNRMVSGDKVFLY